MLLPFIDCLMLHSIVLEKAQTIPNWRDRFPQFCTGDSEVASSRRLPTLGPMSALYLVRLCLVECGRNHNHSQGVAGDIETKVWGRGVLQALGSMDEACGGGGGGGGVAQLAYPLCGTVLRLPRGICPTQDPALIGDWLHDLLALQGLSYTLSSQPPADWVVHRGRVATAVR